MASMPRYDVYEFDEPAFELADLPSVPPTPMIRGRRSPTVSRPPLPLSLLACRPLGSTGLRATSRNSACCATGNLKDNYEVRRTRDE